MSVARAVSVGNAIVTKQNEGPIAHQKSVLRARDPALVS